MATPLPRDATVAVIGAGTMGAGIAQVAARRDIACLLFDARLGAGDAACASIATDIRHAGGERQARVRMPRRPRSRGSTPVQRSATCVSAALVVEAIVEDLDVKRKLFARARDHVGAGAILATNTSSLSVTSLAAGMKHPGRVVGMHFFNPAPVLPLVEVVSGLATRARRRADDIRHRRGVGQGAGARDVDAGIYRQPLRAAVLRRSWRLLNERAASPATIDAVMREAGGFRMGPFELMDLIGHDVNLAVTTSVWHAYHYDPRYTPSVAQRELVAAGYHGRKTRRGIYDYAEGAEPPAAATEPSQSRAGARRRPRRRRTGGGAGRARRKGGRGSRARARASRVSRRRARCRRCARSAHRRTHRNRARAGRGRRRLRRVRSCRVDYAHLYAPCARAVPTPVPTQRVTRVVGTLQAAGSRYPDSTMSADWR